MLTPDY